jgi:hypothetical protein
VKRCVDHPQPGREGLPRATVMRDRLNSIRRRKQTFRGHAVDTETLLRWTATERAQQGDR